MRRPASISPPSRAASGPRAACRALADAERSGRLPPAARLPAPPGSAPCPARCTVLPAPAVNALGPLRRHAALLAAGVLALLFTNALAQVIPWAIKLTIETIGAGRPPVRLALLIAGLAAAQGAIRILSRVFIFNVGRQVEYELRDDLLAHLLRLAPSYYRRVPTGEVMSRLTNDLTTVRAMYGPGILYVANTAFAYAFSLPLMLRISGWLTAAALLPFPVLLWGARRIAHRMYATGRELQEALGELSTTLQEDLSGVAVVKNYALEDARERAFAERSRRYLSRSMAVTRARGVLTPVTGLVGGLGTVVVLLVGGRMVIQGRITLGDLVAFNMYLAMLAWPTLAIGWMMSLWQRGLASLGRLRQVLDERPTIVDGPDAQTPDGDLEIRSLTLRHGERTVLDDVSIVVPRGTLLGVVGRVGSGKSTLCEALPRLVEIPEGTVFWGKKDVTRLGLHALRTGIGYAPQEPFLFSATIRRNIEYGRRDGNGTAAGEDVALFAAEIAGLGPDLRGFPDGIETLVGERGITLSGGQRQRVALARALATRPRLLILDDSLSSVDAHTEREILGRLREELRDRTAVILSHRVSALRDADQIVVLENGRIVERGKHDDLLARGGTYADLYSRQTLEEELEGL
jgi:ATP-binding cassette, subfamily B, multidrug efflux pump